MCIVMQQIDFVTHERVAAHSLENVEQDNLTVLTSFLPSDLWPRSLSLCLLKIKMEP